MWRIFYPLRYFALYNAEKSKLDTWPTLIFTILLSFPYIISENSSFFLAGGFIDKILPLTSALTAFYVAALVGVATFSNESLDKPITLGSIYFIEKDEKGDPEKEFLTRREFACIIFGYLSFLALIFSITGALSITVDMKIGDIKFFVGKSSYSFETWKILNIFLQQFFLLLFHI